MSITIDSAIFIGFLLINLVVGLSYGKGVKTVNDYALGGRNFSTGALVATIVATKVSGSGFFIVLSKTYSDGLYYIFADMGMVLSMILVGVFLIPRMGEFLGKLSVAEAMGDLYGRDIRLICAVCGILGNIGGIAVQFKVFGNVFHHFLGIEGTVAVFIASTIVILYSTFGGIRAVTYTDVVQFLTFGFVVPLIGVIIWNNVYDLGFSFKEIMQSPNFDYTKVLDINNPRLWEMVPLFLYFAFPTIDAMYFQRISMAQSVAQAKKAFLISAILFGCIDLMTAWIPSLIHVINTNLQPNEIISYLVDNYTYTGLKGLMIVGIAAMAMSTADSRINASAVLFANDFSKVLGLKFNHLLLSKIFSLSIGILAIGLALSTGDLLSMIMMSASFYMCIVSVPFILTILGFRSSKKSLLIGMGSGFITAVWFNMFNNVTNGIVLSMLINFIFLLGSHYLLKQPGGWVGIKDRTFLNAEKKIKQRNLHNFKKAISNFSFLEFCKKTAPKNELMYTGLGIYFTFFTISTMYSTQIESLKENGKLILIIYQIMMCTGTVMAMYPIWPQKVKREIIVQVAWNIVIFYMLIFFSCFFVMVSNFGQLQFTIFTMNMMITAILIGWRLSAAMMIIGFYLSVQFYKFYAKAESISISMGSPQFVFMYSLMLVGSALVIFLKPKEEYQELTEEKNEHLTYRIAAKDKEVQEALAIRSEFLRNIPHEYHAAMTGIMSMAEVLKERYNALSDKLKESAIHEIYKSAISLKAFDDNIVTLARLAKPNFQLKKEAIDFTSLVYERIQTCRKLYEENQKNREFILDIADGINVNADKAYFIQLLDNLIINAIKYCPKGKITVSLHQKPGSIRFSIADEGIGILKSELYDVFEPFTVSSKTKTPAGGRGIGLAICKRVVEVHNGSIKAESNGEKGAIFTIDLPI